MFDALIIGGSFAGLSAATYIARARRKVLVIDAGYPRNRFTPASHGFLGHDGAAPADILATARTQLLAYPTVQVISGEAVSAHPVTQGFSVTLADGTQHRSARLLLATGVTDLLPDIDGLKMRWGLSVLHCPYCHGYELDQAPIGVLAVGPLSVLHAMVVAEWGPTTLLTNGLDMALTPEMTANLTSRGITIEPMPLASLLGPAPELSAVKLIDGREIEIKGLFIAAQTRMTSPIAAHLGCAFDEGPLGPLLRVDAAGQTTISGVYAAGDMIQMRHAVGLAVASGIAAGVSLHQSLLNLPAH